MSQLILASTSPRRKELLTLLGVKFKVVPSGYEERRGGTEEVQELVEELALGKARMVAERLATDEEHYLVLGGDTLIEEGGEILGKAENESELKEMLWRLSGKKHRVVTGVAVVDSWSGEVRVESEESWVKFRELSEELIERYLKLPVWQGKAGGYAIQHDPMGFVEGFEGNLSNIIGLPLGLTKSLLEEMGVVVGTDLDGKLLEDYLITQGGSNKW